MRAKRNPCPAADSDSKIHIHGWDSTGWFCHEPTNFLPEARETAAILRKLRKAPGAYHGKSSCRVPGFPTFAFQTTAYDLTDSGLAIVHLDGFPGGPIAALAIVPAHRRPHLRNEFAFGLVAHLSFLDGLINPASELVFHDYAEDALRTEPPCTLVFTVETAHAHADVSVVLSAYLEKLSIAMLHWLCAKDTDAEAREEDVSRPLLMPDHGLYASA